MKRIVQKALAGLLVLSLFGLLGCKKESILPPTVKVFDGAIMVSYTSARVAAEVVDQGGAEVKSRGFVFGLPGSSLDSVFCGNGLGVYSAEINNLLPNTTYIYEAFARNAGGTSTSGKVTFTTQDIALPTVKTDEVTEVTTTTAMCGGEVINDGGATVSERGVCLSAQHTPDINDQRFASGQGLGAFSIEATGLSSNTTYYVRAYAINAKGVNYGEKKSFVTDAEPEQNYTISVAASPSEGGTVSGGGTYQEGQSCTVEAVAKPGYTFTKWTENGNEASTSARYTFNVNSDRTLVANFIADTPNSYTISVSANPTNGGTVTGGGMFEQGQSCTVNATAAQGYSFSNWTENGNAVSTNAHYTFNVTGNRTLVANFVADTPNSYTISVAANPTSGGTVTGGGTYQQGQSCTVSATANSGYTFLRWTENGQQVSTNSSYTFTVTGNRTLVAQFQGQSYTISVSANPTAGGTVNGGGTYNHGQSCTVKATPANGYEFLRWTENGQQVSSNANYTFNVTSNRTLVAQFQAQGYTISVSANPSSGGTVSGGGNYNYGQSCTVTAMAATGYTFLRWTENGQQVSTNSSYTFTVNGNRTLVAQFQAQGYTISVSANSSSGGSVSGGGSFNYGQSCTLVATPATGYTFLKWTKNGTQVSTNASYTFTVTASATYVAHFQANSYTISVSANPTNGGNVTGGGTYNHGQSCTLAATAASGYTFTNWTEGGSVVSTYANYTFNVTRNRTLKANFISSTHEYVDLGLPSGLLWATCNVGAENPEDYGNCFAWGETQSKNTYAWGSYQYCMGNYYTLTKYCYSANYGYNGFTDNLITLQPSDDAATANWGDGWRMPTQAEWNELLNNTTSTWTTRNGVNGRLFTAQNGNSLFLPAAGYCYGTYLNSDGSGGYYWSSSLHLSHPDNACTFYFSFGNCSMNGNSRDYGRSVRAVRSASQN